MLGEQPRAGEKEGDGPILHFPTCPASLEEGRATWVSMLGKRERGNSRDSRQKVGAPTAS